ncbi:flavin reductase family protein [Bacteroidia bacterium]|nr:flavin reductase family protein [Bacteroidia bacterium]
MISIDPKELTVPKLHQYLLGSIGPRPIAFASTIDKDGHRNLAPFSFFNVFSANPPILIFSPARSGRTNTNKDTYHNVKNIPEVVINVVTYAMVNQMSLASSPFDITVDEFKKSGFTPIASDTIQPYRVLESPIQIECKVIEIKELGENGGAGNLIFCEVLKMHIDDSVLDDNGMVDQQRIDLVSRMGGNWYCRADSHSMFEIDKPLTTIGIGVDVLPRSIRENKDLTGNELGKLGMMESIPSEEERLNILNHYTGLITLSEAKRSLELNHVALAYAILTELN